jgi:hypothetical protein
MNYQAFTNDSLTMMYEGNALLDLRQAPLHLSLREVVVARIDRLELAAVDRNARFRQQKLADAAQPLHSSLDDQQKRRFAEALFRRDRDRQPY